VEPAEIRFKKEVTAKMGKKLKVLFISSECEPFARTGGLGDVSAALPEALSEEEVIVRRVLPLYRTITDNIKYKADFSVPMNDKYQGCILKYDSYDKKVPTYFISNDYYFNRNKFYGYFDDGERFLFFCKAVVEMLKIIPFKPDIIHCNDWHTAFIPLLLKASGSHIKTVFTIHNLRYSGVIPGDYINEYGISHRNLEKIGYPDNLNFMKAGILFADQITTVSKTYASEILTSEYGEGFDELLLERKNNLSGILNGIDTRIYNPENAAVPFCISSIYDKEKNKVLLRNELNLDHEDVPVVASVTRLDDQKGIDLILSALQKMDIKEFQFVLLGTGSEYYEGLFKEMADMYPGKMAVRFAFDSELSKRIYAGSDIFIMPSLFEPGGLGQLYAMSYGTIPVVRSTGGLKDTVIDVNDDRERANGFCFKTYLVNSFIAALKQAISEYNTSEWETLIKNCMACDRSWKISSMQYMDLYNTLTHENRS